MNPEASVRDVLELLVDAWNRGDGASFASLFTENADYVTGDGEWLRGPAIETVVPTIGTPARVSIQGQASIRREAGMATAVFRWATVDSSRGVTSCVLLQQGDGGLIDRLQNTDEPRE